MICLQLLATLQSGGDTVRPASMELSSIQKPSQVCGFEKDQNPLKQGGFVQPHPNPWGTVDTSSTTHYSLTWRIAPHFFEALKLQSLKISCSVKPTIILRSSRAEAMAALALGDQAEMDGNQAVWERQQLAGS